MAQIIAFYNAKGGVGKTTSTVNVGTILAQKGKNVLLIGMDPQCNLSKLLGLEEDNITFTIMDVLKNDIDINNAIISVNWDLHKKSWLNKKMKLDHSNPSIQMDVICCNRALIRQEEYLSIESLVNTERSLRMALNALVSAYDYILLDCPPSLSELTVNALVAATNVVVPMKVDRFSFDGLGELSQKIADIQETFNKNLEFTGVFITMDNQTNVNKQVKEALYETLGEKAFSASIRQTNKVVESTFDSKPVVIYDSKCTASQDYITLTDELIKKITKKKGK